MQLPYIESRKFRQFGIVLFFVCILGIGALVLIGQEEGRILAEVKPNTSIESELSLLSPADISSRITQDENGHDMFRDEVETLDLAFDPVHLTPEMGKVVLSLVIKAGQASVPEFASPSFQFIGKGDFNLVKADTLEEAAHSEITSQLLDARKGNGDFFVPRFIGSAESHQPPGISGDVQTQTVKVMSATAREEGDFFLKASLEKLKYSYRIEDVTLVVKADARGFNFHVLLVFIVGIFLTALILQVTTPPERRVKGRY